MTTSRKVARRAAGTAFVVAAIVAGVTAGLSGVTPQSPGEITQLLLFVLLASAAVAALMYGVVALATRNGAGADTAGSRCGGLPRNHRSS